MAAAKEQEEEVIVVKEEEEELDTMEITTMEEEEHDYQTLDLGVYSENGAVGAAVKEEVYPIFFPEHSGGNNR